MYNAIAVLSSPFEAAILSRGIISVVRRSTVTAGDLQVLPGTTGNCTRGSEFSVLLMKLDSRPGNSWLE